MAGPTVGILTEHELSDEERSRIWASIVSRASHVDGADFWIEGQPFLIDWVKTSSDMIGEYSGAQVLLGWKPQNIIVVCAMCNGVEDHRILGELCELVVAMTEGVVAFGSLLSDYTDDLRILTAEGIMQYGQETLLRLQAFRQWRKHPDFRMVK